MRLRAVLLFPLTIALVLLGAPMAGALASPLAYPVQGTVCAVINVSTTEPAPGEAFTVTGKNFDPHGHVTLLLDNGDVLKHVTANGKGSFSTQVTTPGGLSGSYLIHAQGGKTDQPSDCPADPALTFGNGASVGNPGHHGGTSFTGVDIALLLGAAALLIAVGVGLNYKSRSKRVVNA